MEVANGLLVMDAVARRLVSNGLLHEKTELRQAMEECEKLGVAPDGLLREVELVERTWAAIGASDGAASIRWDEETARCLGRALRWISEEAGWVDGMNTLRLKLGATSDQLISRASELAAATIACAKLVGEPVKRRSLRDWISDTSSPRLELLRKSCSRFLAAGSWLDLSMENRAWKLRDVDSDVIAEAQELAPFARVEDGKPGPWLVLSLDGFALCLDADPYARLLVDVLRLGVERFLDSARHGTPIARVTETDLALFAADLPRASGGRFLELMAATWLRGTYGNADGFWWEPPRSVLRYHAVRSVEDLLTVQQFSIFGTHTREESAWVLRAIADAWLERGEWRSIDSLLVDDAVGPSFWPAIESFLSGRVPTKDQRAVQLTLEDVLVGATCADQVRETSATIVGTLARELPVRERVPPSRVVELTGLDLVTVERMMPLLDRQDLGISVYSTGDVETWDQIYEYIQVRSADELAQRWPKNARKFLQRSTRARRDDPVANPFSLTSVKDRLDFLSSTGRFLTGPPNSIRVEAAAEMERRRFSVVNGRAAPPEIDLTATPEVEVAGYRVLEEVGSGAHGVVYRAEENSLGAERAIKILNPHPFVDRTSLRERFEREARILARLRHRAVVTYIAFGILADGAPFLVMDYVRGERFRDAARSMTFRERVDVMLDVLDGLAYLHGRDVYHRDVKPSNIVVRADDRQAILVDFGIAFLADLVVAPLTGSMIGTPGYIPPEVEVDARRSRAPNHDIYAAGATLYEVLAGRLPQKGSYVPLAQVHSSLADLDPILEKAVALREDARYASVEDFASDLRAWTKARGATHQGG